MSELIWGSTSPRTRQRHSPYPRLVVTRPGTRRLTCADHSAQPISHHLHAGIVKTKTLAEEPQPTKAMMKLAYRLRGTTVEESARNVVAVMEDIEAHQRRGGYCSVAALKPPPDLEAGTGDAESLWNLTNTLVAPHI